ncbi:Target of rapamycin complex 1 subunit KOG1 [Wickerhamomyces ciferrii]|uniref:Target of rapamycin complex 1 subunit KOG1 n=1 Tax=Wickerhamomyces ciferrii (strain ATCC 14091 / BCRC 22168 / CBS 111 / JCM 3599 / NBRC 0793 / NRRL Y-1031 F-60-10) TaxID=1206466 RepID=K0KP23_WICCF|nr:Target of rapamycin complex 1 subunit KOG1 [Wickerhamomyces ciferrii]CCH42858.1 Target of rapamycin complex 1 subunit KOG1 [Wickerhamomyces ciferrii]
MALESQTDGLPAEQRRGSGSGSLSSMNTEIRHGFEVDKQYMELLANNFFLYFDDKRHHTNGNPITQEEKQQKFDYYQPIPDWKIMKDRQKTVSAAIILCLNLGVDPPDVIKTHPCAKTEAWIDPATYNDTKKAIEAMGKNLQSQYETLSLRTRYKQSLDPCVEDVKRFCNSLRRNARDERILFHYNGHGVPQPTQSGEIWVFNRGYTQYIPVSLYDLQTWLGAPCIYVYDCNSAGNIVTNFKKFVQKRIDDDNEGIHDNQAPSPTSAYIDCIQLAACRSNELLPMDPDLPADLFTCCLTCPIEISIKWFIMQSPIKKSYYGPLLDVAKNSPNGNIIIPGKLTDRRTPLGELNWIFTAITDTIAWTSLPRPLFKRLFRQDLMVAALFRNFLLAKRIMPSYSCHPISDPPLPEIQNHSMWESWDLAIDQVLTQLLKNLNNEPSSLLPTQTLSPQSSTASLNTATTAITNNHNNLMNGNGVPPQSQQQQQGQTSTTLASVANPLPPTTAGTSTVNGVNTTAAANMSASVATGKSLSNYQHSTFFEQHLTAFELWLKYGSSTRQPPEQLPIVLQVLLSQVHRVRALVLLSRFLDLGPWAVYLALSIGIFPYVLKLLQSPASDLKPVLVFIWARIMAVDYKNTQQELLKDKGFNYFLQMLNPKDNSGNTTNNDHKALCALILSLFVKGFKNGQKLCFSPQLVNKLLNYIEESDNPLLRQWCVLLISQLWDQNFDAKWISYKEGIVHKLLKQVNDPIPEVRTSVITAFTNFLPDDPEEEEIKDETNVIMTILSLSNDASPLVRKEIIIFISKIVKRHINNFIVCAFYELYNEISNILELDLNNNNEDHDKQIGYGSSYHIIWKSLLVFACDGHDQNKIYAEKIIDYIIIKLKESPLSDAADEMELLLLQRNNTTSLNNLESKQQFQQQRILPKPIKLNGNSTSLDSTTKQRSVSSRVESTRINNGNSSNFLKRTLSLSNIWKTLGWNQDDESINGNEQLNKNESSLSSSSSHFLSTPHGVYPQPKTLRFNSKKFQAEESLELPILSKFFEYSMEYFQEPQMRKSEIDEPGSLEYTQRIWRRNRNESIINETQPQKNLSLRGDWKTNVAFLNNKTQPRILKFSQFENYLISSDDRDNLTVFDWENKIQLSKFSNGNPFGTKITDLKLLNEDDLPLLLTGSSDGILKIYKDFHSTDQSRLVTSWRGLTDLLLTPRSTGLLTEWQQSRGSLLVTGDVKVIRIWDAPRELCVVDIPARSSSSITSITSDQVAGDIFVSGFGDGSIRVYDRRLDPRDSMVKLWKNNVGNSKNSSDLNRSWITNVSMQRGGYRELVSGSSNSIINLWDIRLNEPVLTFKSHEKTMTNLQIHEHAPIIASGSRMIKIWTTNGDLISNIKNPNGGFNTLQNRTPYISSLSLHPHRMMFAANNTHDPYISVYKCTETMQD